MRLQAQGPDDLCSGPSHGDKFPSAERIARLQKNLLIWFAVEDRGFRWRLASATKYQQVVAEVLLQRTRADAVQRMFGKFIRRFPSWKKLAAASLDELIEYLRPLGLWNRRATSIQALAKTMAAARGRFPKERAEVERLPGVGQYICNAIMMFDQGHCQPLLDVNLARVLERVFGPRKLADLRYDPYLQRLALAMVQHSNPTRLNWAFLDLAAVVCTIQKPRCSVCPLKTECCYAQAALSGAMGAARSGIRASRDPA